MSYSFKHRQLEGGESGLLEAIANIIFLKCILHRGIGWNRMRTEDRNHCYKEIGGEERKPEPGMAA